MTKKHKQGRDDWLCWVRLGQCHSEFCPSCKFQVFALFACIGLCGFPYWKWPSSGKLIASVWKSLFLVTYRAVQMIWSNMGLLLFSLYQAAYRDSKIEQLYCLVLYCRHSAMSAKGCIPLRRSASHQGWPENEVIRACAVIFLTLQTQLLSGTGQCEKLGSVSGHFSHHHSFPSLETDWSISFFCLFQMGTNGSFPYVPAALKGFLVSPEYIMQCCRASPFFFSTLCLYHVL